MRRQDPYYKETTRNQKFKKQPDSFSSPYRHKRPNEELPPDKMKKQSVFPNSSIKLDNNWKNKIYFVKAKDPSSLSALLAAVHPPIYRLSEEKDGIESYHLITNKTFLDDIAVVNGGEQFEDHMILAQQKAVKEEKKQ